LVQKCGFEEGRKKHTSCMKKPVNDKKGQTGKKILGPYIPYGLFQTKGELCAKLGSDWFRNVNLYKVQTNTHKLTFSFIYKMYRPSSVVFLRHSFRILDPDPQYHQNNHFREKCDDFETWSTGNSPIHVIIVHL
jgi:hypothetical protein